MLDSCHRWAGSLAALSLWMLSWLMLSSPAAAAGKTASAKVKKTPDSKVDSPTYDLQYKFQPGEVVRWEIVHRAAVDTTIQGTNQTAETRSISVKAWKITDVSADRISLVHSVESIDMWQKSQGRQEVRYNSRTDDTVPAGYEDVAKAVGIPLTVLTIDRRGKVLSREDKNPQSTTNTAPITMPLPTKPVAVGHTWSVPLDVEVILHGGASKKVATRQQFTLEKVVDGLATIQVDMQVLAPLNDPAIEAQLVQRLTNGSLKFDIDRGRVVSQQMDTDRRVIGFSGAASSMHYLTRFTEEILPATAVAAKPKKAAATASPPAAVTKTPAPLNQPPRR